MRHVVGYVRVSTARQKEEGLSLAAQRERIAGWCAGCGAGGEAQVFEDAGISGKRADNRPGLAGALEAVCESGGVLVVYSLSRLARSVRDTLAIAERLEKAGADLVSLSESIDTTSAAGKMVFRLLAVLAEFERDLISERVRGIVAYKRARGERIGQLPYGKRLDPDGMTLRDDPGERNLIANVQALHRNGLSPRAIAREFDRRGHPTKNGGTWSHSTIRRLISRGDDGEGEGDDRGPGIDLGRAAPAGDRGAG